MMIGFLVLAVITIGLLAGYVYYWLKRLEAFLGYPPDNWKRKLPLVLLTVLICAASLNLFSTTGIVLLHFWLLAMLFDLILWLLRKHPGIRAKTDGHGFRAVIVLSLIPMVVTAAMMGYGASNITRIQRTDYTLTTDKLSPGEHIRVLLITDVHYDTIQSPAVLADAMAEMQAADPDLIVLAGDIVEEGTSAPRMQEVFQLLGNLKSPLGTYFVYGNHDRQLYSRNPRYTQEELWLAIEGSGIQILQDSTVDLGNAVLAGREDASLPGMPAAQLLAEADHAKLILLADHQPTRAKENAAAGADIQLSGHTHAGQIWPIGNLIELFGSLNYGHYTVDGSHVYVSSGFAGWGFTVRTSEHCEYAVLDISG